ncbi:MAG: hypothetical protein COU69_04625, partial [Candidatus Pacebacteria bacterium CG10_big_fil_rev_8_21_14_0_10_56_10]
MDKRYQPTTHEPAVRRLWEKLEIGNPDSAVSRQLQRHQAQPANRKNDRRSSSPPFVISMPPPNANDPLHVGHALGVAVQDSLIRFHRMRGDDTLWLPGTDHAGIETQFVFEQKLKKQGKSRFDYDRQKLYQLIWDYVQQNSTIAIDQKKRLGASADWGRFVFTLDPDNVEVVLETFQHLHRQGLVYRDLQLVNFCPHCGTAFSNLEVDHVQRTSPWFEIKYGPLVIGTVRPETKFRDTALAVHPDDPRYQDYIGRTLTIDGLLGPSEMTVLADPDVDPEFGTGVMKVTPAHDPHDFELGRQHKLAVTPIIDFDGRMDFSWYINKKDFSSQPKKYQRRAQEYHGLTISQMRQRMKQDLAEDGLLVGYRPEYRHTLAVCYRCSTAIEPLPLAQFFIRVNHQKPDLSLTKAVLDQLDSGQVTIHGAGHHKTLKHWLKTLKDWNISRQIVWGIRQPVWYDTVAYPDIYVKYIDDQGSQREGSVGNLLREKSVTLDQIKAGLQSLRSPLDAEYVIATDSPGETYIQETDTFDTWFSSGQWPFSTLQALDRRANRSSQGQDQRANFQRFYPTQVMETSYDILVFWVMRMLLLGKLVSDQPPFSHVYLHGLVRDQSGRKMSKSKGNVINPLEVVDRYGADALRMALIIRSSAGLDRSVGHPDFKAMRNLTNKIWNASRFIILQLDEAPASQKSGRGRTGATLQNEAKFYDRL